MTGNNYNNKKEEIAQGKTFVAINLAGHIHFDQIDSTNNWAKSHSDEWNPQGITLVTASSQSAGRGRFKRQWISPPGVNIYATFCFWFEDGRLDSGHIPQVLAIAAAKTLQNEGFSPKIKWPNDVLLNNKKIAGILCETIVREEKRGIICGIGLNVNMPHLALEQIDKPATSLLVEGGHLFDVEAVLALLTKTFISDLNHFLKNGFSPFFPFLQEHSALKSRQSVTFVDRDTPIDATFVCLRSDGSVELRLSNGNSVIFYVGEFIL